jgi:hypothetical protein
MAEAVFASLGTDVRPEDVPLIVANGRDVFALGYGESYDEYDAIADSDLWAWPEQPVDGMPRRPRPQRRGGPRRWRQGRR